MTNEIQFILYQLPEEEENDCFQNGNSRKRLKKERLIDLPSHYPHLPYQHQYVGDQVIPGLM